MRGSRRWWAAVLLWGAALIAEARPGKEGFTPMAYRPLVRFRHKVSIFPISLAIPLQEETSARSVTMLITMEIRIALSASGLIIVTGRFIIFPPLVS